MMSIKSPYVHSLGCIAAIDGSSDSLCGCDEFLGSISTGEICVNCLHSFDDHIGMTIDALDERDYLHQESLAGVIAHLEFLVSCMLRVAEDVERQELHQLERELAIQDQTRLREQIRVLDAIKENADVTSKHDADDSLNDTPPRQKARRHSPTRSSSASSASLWALPASSSSPASASSSTAAAASTTLASSPFKAACDDWMRVADATVSARIRLHNKRKDIQEATRNEWIAGIEFHLQEMKSMRLAKIECYFNCGRVVSCLGQITSHLLGFWSKPEGIRYLKDTEFARLYRGFFTKSLCHMENILTKHHPPQRARVSHFDSIPEDDLYRASFIQYARISLQPHLFTTLPSNMRPDYFYTTLHERRHCYGKHHPFLFEPISAVEDVAKEVCQRLKLDHNSFSPYYQMQFTDVCGLVQRRTFEQSTEREIESEIQDFRLTDSMIKVSILSDILELAIGSDLKQQIQRDVVNDWKQSNSLQGLTYNVKSPKFQCPPSTISASSSSSSDSPATLISATIPARSAGVPNPFPYKPFSPRISPTASANV